MPIKNERPLRKLAVRIYEGDIEELTRFYPTTPYNVVIREIITQHVRALQEQETRNPEVDHAIAAKLAGRVDLNSTLERGDEHDQ